MHVVSRWAVLGSLLCTGCTSTWVTQSTHFDWQLKMLASSAWHKHKRYVNVSDHPHAFRDGFEAGYFEICSGGDGIAPAVAPRPYRGVGHISTTSRSMTYAWFNGFEEGALAARKDGREELRKIAIPPEADPCQTGCDKKSSFNGFAPHAQISVVPAIELKEVPAETPVDSHEAKQASYHPQVRRRSMRTPPPPRQATTRQPQHSRAGEMYDVEVVEVSYTP